MFSITKYKNIVKISIGFWRCMCGKYKINKRWSNLQGKKSIRGIVCEKCGYEVKHDFVLSVPREEFDNSIGNWLEVKSSKNSESECPECWEVICGKLARCKTHTKTND